MPAVVMYRIERAPPDGLRFVMNSRYRESPIGGLYRRVMRCDMAHFKAVGTLRRDMCWLRLFLGIPQNI